MSKAGWCGNTEKSRCAVIPRRSLRRPTRSGFGTQMGSTGLVKSENLALTLFFRARFFATLGMTGKGLGMTMGYPPIAKTRDDPKKCFRINAAWDHPVSYLDEPNPKIGHRI